MPSLAPFVPHPKCSWQRRRRRTTPLAVHGCCGSGVALQLQRTGASSRRKLRAEDPGCCRSRCFGAHETATRLVISLSIFKSILFFLPKNKTWCFLTLKKTFAAVFFHGRADPLQVPGGGSQHPGNPRDDQSNHEST